MSKLQQARDLHEIILMSSYITDEEWDVLRHDPKVKIQYTVGPLSGKRFRATLNKDYKKYKVTAEAKVI